MNTYEIGGEVTTTTRYVFSVQAENMNEATRIAKTKLEDCDTLTKEEMETNTWVEWVQEIGEVTS